MPKTREKMPLSMMCPRNSIRRTIVCGARAESVTMPLVFVPTPLGNLRDITLRALDVLREAALIVAEDSRVARRLLSAYDLPGRALWTYHEHNAATATSAILERAREALVAV